jgi:hypothetical protein
MIWRAGLTSTQTEIIPGVSRTRIETELFVTDKEKIDKIPLKEPIKKKEVPAKSGKSLTRPHTAKPKGSGGIGGSENEQPNQ